MGGPGTICQSKGVPPRLWDEVISALCTPPPLVRYPPQEDWMCSLHEKGMYEWLSDLLGRYG